MPSEPPSWVTWTPLRLAWSSVAALRRYAGRYTLHDRSNVGANVPLLRYALHSLCLDEVCTGLSRQWALGAACALAASSSAVAASSSANYTAARLSASAAS